MDDSVLLHNIKEKKTKLHEIEEYYDLDYKKARESRLQFVSDSTSQNLNSLKNFSLDEAKLYKKNIENLIGSIEVPLGVAGPIQVTGDFASGSYFIPMATTEGALVASTNRGCSIVSKSGGIQVMSEFVGITRGPIFKTQSLEQVRVIVKYIKNNISEIKNLVSSRENHLRLISIDPYNLGRNLWLRINFDSSEAMGMNMITKASGYISEFLCQKFDGMKLVAVSGNMCIDKKASYINAIMGRGRKVSAEVTIPKAIVENNLKTTVKKIVEINQSKVWQGSAMSGAISFNAHFANIVAAIFIATGQDLAHVVEASQGYSLFEEDENGDLYVSILLPSMVVGTIGGGTGLPKQLEARAIMLSDLITKKMPEENLSSTLAEVTAAAVLCGELSLHAALASNNLISAHESLGRSKK